MLEIEFDHIAILFEFNLKLNRCFLFSASLTIGTTSLSKEQ